MLSSLLLFAALCPALAEEYAAREVMIPMRDGVKLYTQIYTPVDPGEPCPILFTRTPYGIGDLPGRVDPATLGPSPLFAEAGYVFVSQDVRGQFRSEGEWSLLIPPRQDREDQSAVDESTDAHDTIAWLLEHVDGHNGRVGMWGISYDAWETVMAMAEAHPALLAVSPQASPADEFLGDDSHHHGAFRLSYSFAWMAYMAAQRGDAERALIGPVLGQPAYDFFLRAGSLADLERTYFQGNFPDWNDLMEHGDYDEYWQVRNPLHQLQEVRPAVLNVAGWFDAEDFRGPIDIYHQVEKNDTDDLNSLVVGPWQHGGWSPQTEQDGSSLGDLDFEDATAPWYQESVELPFFEYHLRDDADPLLPEVLAFETGGNAWREFDQWPPEDHQRRPLHLHPGGVAAFAPPAASAAGAAGSASEFLSDPADPVPYSRRAPVFPEPEYMVEDQRYLSGRDDVLSFVSEALDEDLVIAGRPEVVLHFTTTGTDADWVVKLIDVYPEDCQEESAKTFEPLAESQILISGDIFRAKYRDSMEHPSPLEPGKLTELHFELPDRLHRFRAGHRLMIQIHSSWFPMYDRNPQVFMDIYHSTPEDLEVATHRVHHQVGAASCMILPVLED